MQESSALVSIGIPTYNRPNGLRTVIDSCLKQTYQNVELIISDNCSDNPEVEAIGKYYAELDTRVRYVRQEQNIGMFENFRFVLKQATGEFFTWISDDDYYKPTHIEETIKGFSDDPSIILCSPKIELLTNGAKENWTNVDFDTVGLSKMERMRKIAFYIKRRHEAMCGIYKTEFLHKVPVRTMLDPDGYLLLQLSQYGAFRRMKNETIVNNTICAENASITLDTAKFIKANNMQPQWLLLRNEKLAQYLIFSRLSFTWPKLSLFQHFTMLGILYRSFWGYNTNPVLNKFRSVRFALKKKSAVAIITVSEIIAFDKVNAAVQACLQHGLGVLLVLPETLQDSEYWSQLTSLSDHRKIELLSSINSQQTDLLRDGIEYLNKQSSSYTHCIPVPNAEIREIVPIPKILGFIANARNSLCAAIQSVKENTALVVIPLRKFVSLKKNGLPSCRIVSFPAD